LLTKPAGAQASFRELAAAAKVSVPTLRHYFPTREGLLEALLGEAMRSALPFLHEIASGPLHPTLEESVAWFLGFQAEGLARGVEAIHALSLSQGLNEPTVGTAYVRYVLEPSLQALEARLARHIARGDMRSADLRCAALMLVGPTLLARLHQGPLGGARCRALDERQLRAEVTSAFVRGFGQATGPPRTKK